MIGFFESVDNRKKGINVSILVGLTIGFLTFGKNLTVNYMALAVVLIGVTQWVLKTEHQLNKRSFIIWSAFLLVYASVFMRSANDIYHVIAFFATPIIYILLSIYSSETRPKRMMATFWFRVFGCIGDADKIFRAAKSLKQDESGNKKVLGKVLTGVGVSFALLCVILPIMFSADKVFESIARDLISFTTIQSIIWRLVISAIGAILFFGFLHTITVNKHKPELKEKKQSMTVFHEGVTLLTVLFTIGFVYTSFAIIQFNYLFIGVDGSLPIDYSYAEYARNGYFELVFLSLINFSIILGVLGLSNQVKGIAKALITIILSYFNILNVYLMVSAGYKMYLYQAYYGSTELRLLVYLLLIFEAIMLVLLAIKVIKRSFNFVGIVLPIAIVFWGAVSFINIEALSIRQNVARYEDKDIHEFDAYYASTRSADASQVIYDFYIEHGEELEDEDRRYLEEYFWGFNYDEWVQFGHDDERLESYSRDETDWRTFNVWEYRKKRLGEALKVQKGIE